MRGRNSVGRGMVFLGVFIILYLLLPPSLLWFLFAVALICVGLKCKG